MTLIDITAPLRPDLPTWPEEPGLSRTVTSDVAEGDPATVSELHLGAHTGTHVDAPVHFLPDGGGVEALPLDVLAGPAVVVDLSAVDGAVEAEDLDAADIPPGTTRLLLKTRNSGWSRADTAFREDFAGLTESAGRWCLDHGIRLVANDYLSIEPFGAEERGHPVHHLLLGAGVVIVEGVDLDGVDPGTWELAVLPLAVPGGDGAPARAVLRRG
jgi:arylformamidase